MIPYEVLYHMSWRRNYMNLWLVTLEHHCEWVLRMRKDKSRLKTIFSTTLSVNPLRNCPMRLRFRLWTMSLCRIEIDPWCLLCLCRVCLHAEGEWEEWHLQLWSCAHGAVDREETDWGWVWRRRGYSTMGEEENPDQRWGAGCAGSKNGRCWRSSTSKTSFEIVLFHISLLAACNVGWSAFSFVQKSGKYVWHDCFPLISLCF